MDKEKMCPILTVGQAIMLAHRRDAAFESCWWPCAGENCVMYESCVPQVLTVVSQIGERPEGGWCDDSLPHAVEVEEDDEPCPF